jgi:5-methylcytosine-specific restriction protein A
MRQSRCLAGGVRGVCLICTAKSHTTPADVVDHIKPHRGDRALFWDPINWQALCKMHPDSDKARLEHGGRERARFDPSGRLIW